MDAIFLTTFTGLELFWHVIYLVMAQEYIIEQDGNYDPERIDYQ